MKILKQRKLTNKVCVLLFLALIGCNNKDKNTNYHKNSNAQFENESISLSYEFDFNGCKTGKHIFKSRADYCNALLDENLNNSCAIDLRTNLYNNQCLDPSTTDKNSQLPSRPPLPSRPSLPNQANLPPNSSPTKIENSLPDRLYVVAKFEEPPKSISINDDDGSTYTFLGANINRAIFSVRLNDQLNLGQATDHTFIAPQLNNCKLQDYSFDYIGLFNSIFSFGSMEKNGITSCQKFMKAIETDGLHMQFTDVPLLNGNGAKIKFVDLVITNP